MKQASKRVLGIVALSALLIGAGTTLVSARGGYGYGYGPGWGDGYYGMQGGPGRMHGRRGGRGMMWGGPGGFAAGNLQQLKTDLGITPEQEAAWNSYVEAVQGKTDLMASHRQARFSGTVTPQQHLSFRQEGLAQMQKVLDARKGLHAVLTPEQQTKAGALTGFRCRRR